MTDKEKVIYKIAEEFIKTHNPNEWDGNGEPDKDFQPKWKSIIYLKMMSIW